MRNKIKQEQEEKLNLKTNLGVEDLISLCNYLMEKQVKALYF